MTYLKGFQNLLKELQQHPQVAVQHVYLGPALDQASLLAIERELAQPLPLAFKQFYRECNGLRLQWIFKTHPEYEQATAPASDWLAQTRQYGSADGCIWIPSLQEMLAIGYFDLFSFYHQVRFLPQEGLLQLWEDGLPQPHFPKLDLPTYWQQVLQQKALILPRYHRLSQVWRDGAMSGGEISLSKQALAHRFPLSDQLGSATQGIDSKGMQAKSKQNKPLSAQELAQRTAAHQAFLAQGGGGGQWQVLLLKGRTLGLYRHAQADAEQQAIFDGLPFPPSLDLRELHLPYSSWVAAYLYKQDLSDSDLAHSLFVDALLDKTIFADANLTGCDFSRASLKSANFMNANLSGCDFENADLTGANFQGAILTGARFPGAVLKNILY
jgi:uncharacterized protein YjbI with pentapeptide repeats